MRDPALWKRLQAFRFDGPGSAPFSVKLARTEGWNAGFTLRVIEEYRRFLYLTQISDRQVTPSQIVDAAWHMHLTFTRDYWEDLCPNVIGKAVHHQPCAGEEDMPRYRDQFAATKALNEAEFGTEPPADIWARDHARPVRRFATSELGSFTSSPAFIAFIPFALSVGLAIWDPGWLIILIAVFTGVLFLIILFNGPRRRRRRDGGDATHADDGIYYGDDDDGDAPANSGSTSRGAGRDDKHSRPDDTARSGGFWAMVFGDGDGGDDGGGGCGGCGD